MKLHFEATKSSQLVKSKVFESVGMYQGYSNEGCVLVISLGERFQELYASILLLSRAQPGK
jgi:hypothetical protein